MHQNLKIIKQNFEQLYAHMYDNTDKINQFCERYNSESEFYQIFKSEVMPIFHNFSLRGYKPKGYFLTYSMRSALF